MKDTAKKPALNRKHSVGIETVLLITVVLLLTLSTPQRLGPIGVTVFFLILFLLSLNTLEIYFQRRGAERTAPLWLRAVYAALPVVLLALSSLQQLTLADLLLGVGLVVIITMYSNRRMVK